MDTEIDALREHARFCRLVAAETMHDIAAHRLKALATEYECRAQDLATRGATSMPREISKTRNARATLNNAR
jgi:hypothetical protein